MDVDTKVARAKTRMIFAQPFYGCFAMNTPFVRDDEQPTMCTNAQWIKWNGDFVDGNDDHENIFTIAHEISHIALLHCLIKTIGGQPVDQQLLNIATDFVINGQLIDAGVGRMPEGGLYDPKYTGWTWEEVYRDIEKQSEGERPTPQPWGGDISAPEDANGNPATPEQVKQIAADINGRLLQAASAAKAAGNLPASIAQVVEKIRRPKVDYADVLRRFMGGEQPDDYTFRKPNKHAWHEQGVYLPTLQNDGIGHIAMLFDCSGSMSTPELEQGLAEVKSLVEEFMPSSVTVVQFDSIVQKVDTFENGDFVNKIDFTGRGGTKVEPAFKYLEREGIQHDQIIVFSDMGIGDYPDIVPDVPVLWVSTSGRDSMCTTTPPFGEITYIEEAA